jgi:hypothetical protein
VHAGEHLFLLLDDGWVAVRYEWGFKPDSSPRLYLGIAGADDAACLCVPDGARLAWPDQFQLSYQKLPA